MKLQLLPRTFLHQENVLRVQNEGLNCIYGCCYVISALKLPGCHFPKPSLGKDDCNYLTNFIKLKRCFPKASQLKTLLEMINE